MKKYISRSVLSTELHMVMRCIDEQNYGYAKDITSQVLARVKEYDLSISEIKKWLNYEGMSDTQRIEQIRTIIQRD